jgi:hypothetical protein
MIDEFCSIHPDIMVWKPNTATVVNKKRAMLSSTSENPAWRDVDAPSRCGTLGIQ